MQKSKGKSAIMDRVSIYTQLFLLNLIDITTLGGSLMTKDTNSNLSSVSMLLTFLSLLLSQLNYNIFTKIPVAVCAGPILEASTLITKLCTSISKKVDEKGLIINCVVALCICTLIYGIISIIISIFDVSDYLFLIPHSVILGILSAVGIMLINLSYQLLEVKATGKEKLGIFYFIFLVIVALIIVFLEKRYNFNYLPPFFLLIVTIGLFATKIIFKINEDFLIKYTIISSKVSLNEGLKILRKNFDFKLLNFKVIFKEYRNIIALSFFYLLHLPINLSSYSKVTKVKFNLKKEFRTQGLSNILGSVLVIPVYFICCYSIMLAESGCSTFLDGILLVLVYSFNYFLAGTVRSCVPVLGLALFPVLIGYSFCINGFTAIQDGSLIEFLVIWIIAIIGGFEILAMYNLFALGVIFSFIYYFVSDWYYKKCKEAYNSRFMEEFSQNFGYLKVNYLLYFKNAGKFKRDSAKINSNTIIIDLIGCGAFDMLGNEVFRDNIKEDRTYFVIGSPANFNLGPISGLKNVYLCNDYLHASEKISEITQK